MSSKSSARKPSKKPAAKPTARPVNTQARKNLAAAPAPAAPAVPAFAKPRSVVGYLGITLRGIAMGSADVVPGVSGGTIAFLVGIYEELIESIRMVGRPPFIRALLGFRIVEALKIINFPFLLSLVIGIGLAVLTLAPGIEWMLENQPVLLWSFFFGLVVASVVTVARRIPRWTLSLGGALVIGAVGAYWLVGLVPVTSPTAWWFLFLSGAIAICAMILPGISGSFILVLLGKYQYILGAVNDRNIIPIIWVGLGAAVGIVTFAQLLSWLFKRYHDITVAVLTGFMLGSLRKVWPWKEVLSTITGSHGEAIPTVERNILPPLTQVGAFNLEVAYALGLAILGFVVVLAVETIANRRSHAA
jgi:putative membrane protein